MPRFAVSLTLVLVLLSSGCARQQPAAILRDLLGLEVGRHAEYAGEGNEYAAFTTDVAHRKGNLYQIAEDNGGTVVARVLELRRDGAYEILTRGEYYTGESLLESEAVTRRDRKLDRKILPWPLREGNTWTLPDGTEATLVATNTKRTVPAGTFDEVVHVRTVAPYSPPEGGPTVTDEAEPATMDFFYAPGAGPIERRFTQGDMVVVSRLSSTTSPE